MLEFKFEEKKNALQCIFNGHISGAVCPKITDELEAGLNKIRKDSEDIVSLKVVFDLKDVSYIASSFIRICMGMAKEFDTGRFSVVNCNPFIKKTFKIAGLDGVFNIT